MDWLKPLRLSRPRRHLWSRHQRHNHLLRPRRRSWLRTLHLPIQPPLRLTTQKNVERSMQHWLPWTLSGPHTSVWTTSKQAQTPRSRPSKRALATSTSEVRG